MGGFTRPLYSLLRTARFHVLVMLMLCNTVCYLDRTNISVAILEVSCRRLVEEPSD